MDILTYKEAKDVVACLTSNGVDASVTRVSKKHYVVKAATSADDQTILPEDTVSKGDQEQKLAKQQKINIDHGGQNKPAKFKGNTENMEPDTTLPEESVADLDEDDLDESEADLPHTGHTAIPGLDTVLPEEKANPETLAEEDEEPAIVEEDDVDDAVASLHKAGKSARVTRLTKTKYAVAAAEEDEEDEEDEAGLEKVESLELDDADISEADDEDLGEEEMLSEDELYDSDEEARAEAQYLRKNGIHANVEYVGKKFAVSVKAADHEKLEELRLRDEITAKKL